MAHGRVRRTHVPGVAGVGGTSIAIWFDMSDDPVRSGDFSQDPAFDPEAVFGVIEEGENLERIEKAMREFLGRGQIGTFERAVAVFVRSARARHDSVERVLALLIKLADDYGGQRAPHDLELTDLRRLVLRGVLLAFYGDSRVPRTKSAEA